MQEIFRCCKRGYEKRGSKRRSLWRRQIRLGIPIWRYPKMKNTITLHRKKLASHIGYCKKRIYCTHENNNISDSTMFPRTAERILGREIFQESNILSKKKIFSLEYSNSNARWHVYGLVVKVKISHKLSGMVS